MITKYGEVVIKEDKIEITHFTYDGAGEKFDETHPLISVLEREAIKWAISRLQESLWIKCSERMPREDEWVLVYLRKSITTANYSPRAENWYNDEERFKKDEVTHWMPFPEKPKIE